MEAFYMFLIFFPEFFLFHGKVCWASSLSDSFGFSHPTTYNRWPVCGITMGGEALPILHLLVSRTSVVFELKGNIHCLMIYPRLSVVVTYLFYLLSVVNCCSLSRYCNFCWVRKEWVMSQKIGRQPPRIFLKLTSLKHLLLGSSRVSHLRAKRKSLRHSRSLGGIRSILGLSACRRL